MVTDGLDLGPPLQCRRERASIPRYIFLRKELRMIRWLWNFGKRMKAYLCTGVKITFSRCSCRWLDSIYFWMWRSQTKEVPERQNLEDRESVKWIYKVSSRLW